MAQQRCNWCRESTDTLVLVGIIETGSGPGRFIYACPKCRTARGIKAFRERDPDSDGRPSYRDPGPVPPLSPVTRPVNAPSAPTPADL